MRELAQIRQELDEIDREMVKLFERRMTLCREVARTKLAQGKPVLDASREAQVLKAARPCWRMHRLRRQCGRCTGR